PFYTRHHRDHHSCRYYGTSADPEYAANLLLARGWTGGLFYTVQILVYPVLFFLRFLLSPLTFLRPQWRTAALRHASSLTMNWHYERETNEFDRTMITWVELLCFVRAAFI